MTWRQELLAHARARRQADVARFPLVRQTFTDDELLAMVDVIVSGRLTMGEEVKRFEQAFAARLGVRHAVMVNSGSSANLLAVAALVNPSSRRRPLQLGDEVLVPAVCWSTSVWPIVQCGLRPVFVDVDPMTLNMDLEDLARRITPRSRAVLAVHVLGNACDVGRLVEICDRSGLELVEDTCESLGSRQRHRELGTFGRFGTYSFYFSHHMTTGEGGMVICDDDDDAALLRCLRAHGWTREQPDRDALEARFSDVDPRFLFVNVGYNVRPMEVQAALGRRQLERLDEMNARRRHTHARLIAAIRSHPRFAGQIDFPQAGPDVDAAWFGFPMLLRDGVVRSEVLAKLSAGGVEHRPIVSGNFARQPGLRLHGVEVSPAELPGAEQVHHRGLFVGLHADPMSDVEVDELGHLIVDAVTA